MTFINIPGVLPTEGDLRQSTPIGVGSLGLVIFDDITFPPDSYTNLKGNRVEYSGLSLQSGSLSVSQAWNRVRTPISGRNGTVKESVALGDIEIRIETKITELANVFPADQIEAWKNIKNSPENIPVISKWLNDAYDVRNVVIDDFQFNTIPGSINEVNLLITASSDETFSVTEFDLSSGDNEPISEIFLFT